MLAVAVPLAAETPLCPFPTLSSLLYQLVGVVGGVGAAVGVSVVPAGFVGAPTSVPINSLLGVVLEGPLGNK